MAATPDLCIIPVQPCAPWCISIEGTHRQEHPNDRECCSEFHAVPLTLHKPVDWGTPGDRWDYDKLDVLLRQTNGGAVELVMLHEAGCPQCDRDHELRTTVDEARQLHAALGVLLGGGDGPTPEGVK